MITTLPLPIFSSLQYLDSFYSAGVETGQGVSEELLTTDIIDFGPDLGLLLS